MADEHRITWSYETYTFSTFFESYLAMCRSLERTNNINEVHNIINVFISEYLYAVPKKDIRASIIDKLSEIKQRIDYDDSINYYFSLSNKSLLQESEFLRLFYKYFIELIEVLAFFMSNLSSTFLPHTATQKKFLRYYNNEFFFQKLTEHKKEILGKLSNFDILNFSTSLISFTIYYMSYNLFVTVRDRSFIDKCLSIIISKLLSDDVLKSISLKPNIPERNIAFLKETSKQVHSNMLLCNTAMNNSFSKYGILPKVYDEIARDMTLI